MSVVVPPQSAARLTCSGGPLVPGGSPGRCGRMEHVLHAMDHRRPPGTLDDVDQALQPQQLGAAMLGSDLEEEAERHRMQRLLAAQAEGVDAAVAVRGRLIE